MSVNIRRLEVAPGSDDHVEAAWRLKERIRRNEGVLRQRKNFFSSAYTRSRVFLYKDETRGRLIGFATVRRDGYLLFLAVDDDYRGQGFGKRLIARVAEEFGRVTCHARTTNRNALNFYRGLGFETVRRIENYYEDGGDAYYLQLGDDASIREKLASLLRR
ncbi:Ribosomal protein S18 acetylase RimI [Halovenus aranensis]|uniref:Ribosomal protein S18 acetylase RimI n=1 Tax=Halovenus aranensis TaxID=890420 RepID=A0A1G8SXF8_9EURY|nr:N-acetyltransferase [Halovenus aranensis]SDJ33949.1 Ribosomal protein S18 acetylase RimI [Halovenus aranensis]